MFVFRIVTRRKRLAGHPAFLDEALVRLARVAGQIGVVVAWTPIAEVLINTYSRKTITLQGYEYVYPSEKYPSWLRCSSLLLGGGLLGIAALKRRFK